MHGADPWRPLSQIVFGLLFAIWVSGVVRSATVQLNQTLGLVWPFSLAHCRVAATPGCGRPTWVAFAEPASRLGAFQR